MAELIKKLESYEPKRLNRWVLNFPDLEIKEWYIAKAQRPKFVRRKNWLGFYSGYKVDKFEIVLRDPISPSMALATFDLIKKDKRKLEFTLEMLDPTGVVVEKWVILDCEIIEIDFGELDYTNDGIAEVKLILQPYDAHLLF